MTGTDIDLTPEDARFFEELIDYRKFHRMEFFEPYPKQREFIALGKTKNERCLFAGNRMGKTEVGAYETACHLTGLYPPDWEGRTWNHPVRAWAAGSTTSKLRDVSQAKLFGEPGVRSEMGTGFIPKECIIGTPTAARGGAAEAYDTARIKHFTNGVEDGVSVLQFKPYTLERRGFEGSSLHFLWWDEEPPPEVYNEGNVRWTENRGMSLMTFTPMEGMSKVVLRFVNNEGINAEFVRMSYRDCPHFTPEMIDETKNKYQQHEWGARLEGLPFGGAGVVFRKPLEELFFDPGFDVPPYWLKLWGCDFGIGHPFAAVLCLYDRETETFYVYKEFRVKDAIPSIHADAINRIGAGIPIAWPHDGNQRETGGETIASLYRKLGLPMMDEHATFPDGGYSTEAAIREMDQAMQAGTFKVASDLYQWAEEYRGYHRDEKTLKVVKTRDDLLSATMKAWMMKRRGRTGLIEAVARRPQKHTLTTQVNTDFDVLTGRPFPRI